MLRSGPGAAPRGAEASFWVRRVLVAPPPATFPWISPNRDHCFLGAGLGGGGGVLFCSTVNYLFFPWDICLDCGLKVVSGSESPFLICGAHFFLDISFLGSDVKDPWDHSSTEPAPGGGAARAVRGAAPRGLCKGWEAGLCALCSPSTDGRDAPSPGHGPLQPLTGPSRRGPSWGYWEAGCRAETWVQSHAGPLSPSSAQL